MFWLEPRRFGARSVEKRGDQSRFKSLGLYIHVTPSRYRNRTMLLTVYMERSVADADKTISLRGRSRRYVLLLDFRGNCTAPPLMH